MGSSPSRPTFTDAGPTIAPGANPPNLNPRRDLNVTRPCDMGNFLQAINELQTCYCGKPGIVIAGGVFVAVLLLIVVIVYMLRKRQKAGLRDRRYTVGPEKEQPKGYQDEVILSSYV
ncbi:hypothetical protein IW261DRAFT_1608821 [Armillaria novae-zelandiae]|uniref:Uncharacterized protein n=1 Tax=Armillaria novae-zelandiae TaxID=153914 RepID=A0AA39UGH1_9AGAR|nr:hypothetical protein IW261DRAFT_1608821 [Armillaria novae-zelandiae]